MLDVKVDDLVIVEGVEVVGEARSTVAAFPRRAWPLYPPPLIHLALGCTRVTLDRCGHLLGYSGCGFYPGVVLRHRGLLGYLLGYSGRGFYSGLALG